MSELNKEYEASLKSIETENKLDRIFYRPIGFCIARALKGTGITPNMVTVLSIFVGAAAGFLFYPDNLWLNVCGILCLIMANILDCVDGQLARLTGIKSAIGRILDGVAGDIWFICIYLGFAFRLINLYGSYAFLAIAVVSGLSHLVQANLTDYYKTLHLYFISKEKGAELQTVDQVRANHKALKPGLEKAFFFLYSFYTLLQFAMTPKAQKMLRCLQEKYGDQIPDDIRLSFRQQSSSLMKRYIDWLTFNGRTVMMFIIVLTGQVWGYFIFEIIILNTVMLIARHKHEKMCDSFCH